jgi:hypothetical protein
MPHMSRRFVAHASHLSRLLHGLRCTAGRGLTLPPLRPSVRRDPRDQFVDVAGVSTPVRHTRSVCGARNAADHAKLPSSAMNSRRRIGRSLMLLCAEPIVVGAACLALRPQSKSQCKRRLMAQLRSGGRRSAFPLSGVEPTCSQGVVRTVRDPHLSSAFTTAPSSCRCRCRW